MKTHLPHRLRAALMAALASVSLTSYAAAADLTWSEPGTASSLNDANWSNESATGLDFTTGDNAVFSGTDVGCQGGTIHAGNVDVNGDTTVAGGAAIYSSGTVTIGEGSTLTLDGSELHIVNPIEAGSGAAISGKIYYEGDYWVDALFMGAPTKTYPYSGALQITKVATVASSSLGGVSFYIDGTAVASISEEGVASTRESPLNKQTCLLDTSNEEGFASASVDSIINGLIEGKKDFANTVITQGESTAGLGLSKDHSVTLYAQTNTRSETSGKLTDLYLYGDVSYSLDEGVTATISDLAITGALGNEIHNDDEKQWTERTTGGITIITRRMRGYNSTGVTMKNAKVEVADSVATGKEITLKTKLENVDIENAKAGTKLNVTQGKDAASVKSTADGAEVNLVNISDGTDLALKELLISDNGKIGVYKNGTAAAGTNGDNVGKLTLANGSMIHIGTGGGTLEANLATASGTILDFSDGVPLTMSGNVNAEAGTMFLISKDAYTRLQGGEDVTLFTGVGNSFCMDVTDYVTAADAEKMTAKVYFQTVEGGNAVLSTTRVPEPATGTLSLLALAGLCARRRRKH